MDQLDILKKWGKMHIILRQVDDGFGCVILPYDQVESICYDNLFESYM